LVLGSQVMSGAEGGSEPKPESSPGSGTTSPTWKPTVGAYKDLSAKLQRAAARLEEALHERDTAIGALASNRASWTAVEREHETEIEVLRDRIENLAAVEAGETDNMAEGGGRKVPQFTGEDADSTGASATLWLNNLEELAKVNKWTDAQTLSAALLSLSGEAGAWRVGEELDTAGALSSLANFKTKFAARFQASRSAVEQVSVVASLKQKQSESVRGFYDRVRNGVHLSVASTKHDVLVDGAVPDKKEDGYNACVRHFLRVLFVSGLRPEIRRTVEAKMASIKSADELLLSAVEAEVATAGESRRVMELEAQIAALKNIAPQAPSRGGYSRGGGRGHGRGGGRGGYQGAAAPQDAAAKAKIAARTSWVHCHKCLQWGKHRATECKASKARVEAMTPMDGSVRPTGPPADAYFDQFAAGAVSKN